MPAPTFQALIGDLRTGKITAVVPVTGATWQQVVNAAGTISATVNTAAVEVAGLDLYHTAAPPRAFLCIQYDQTIIAGGPIWTAHANWSAGTLTLGAAGMWSMFDARMLIPVLAEPLTLGAAQAATTTYPTSANKSLGDIAAALVAQALAHVGGNLPIVAPAAQGLTPGATRTYNGYDVASVGQRLAELTAVIGGPEVRFQPRYKSTDPTSVEWVMLVGSPAQPQFVQGGLDWTFDASVPKSMVSDIDVDISAKVMATRAWEVGGGTGVGVLLSQADSTALTSAGYPLTEFVDRTHNGVLVQADLDAYAAQLLTDHNRPAVALKIKVRNDGAPADGASASGPRLGQYVAGDYCQLVVPSGWYLPAGARRARILQIDGDLSFECTLTLSTIAAEV